MCTLCDFAGLSSPAAGMSIASFTVLVAVGGSTVAALLGWWTAARNTRRGGRSASPSRGWRNGVVAFVVIAAVAAAVLAPVIGVMWALVALNFAFGRRENVPFSTYPMFARLPAEVWALQFEDAAGQLVPIAVFGMNPVNTHKRFSRELEVAHAEGITGGAGRQRAAQALAAVLEQHRPTIGPWSDTPITILIIHYEFDSGGITTRRTPIVDTAP